MAESGELNILIETGTDFVLPFTIYDNNGNPLDLTGATVESQLREYAEAYDFFEFACMHNGSGGRITVTMPHETTAQIPFTHGVYDVKVTLADGTISHPLSGEAYIKEGVTKSSDGAILFMLGINSFDDLPEVGNVDRLYFVYSDRRIYRWNGTNYVSTAVGNGIQSIDFVEHVDDFSDKYRITYDDGTHFDYIVTSKGIDYIEKVGSTGTVRTGIIDQYRIHFNNSTTHDYYVTNGRAFDVKTSYDSTQAYEYLDMVRVNGATYVAVQDVPADTAITNTDYWLKIFAPLTIGTVSTVSAETGASASIGGTPDAPTLNLSIPRGVTGNESIDDSKAIGDTDYVWSADAVVGQLNRMNLYEENVVIQSADNLLDVKKRYINSSDEWENKPAYRTILVPIPDNAKALKIKAHASNYTRISFLTTNSCTEGDSADYTATNASHQITADTTEEIQIPTGAKYVYVTLITNATRTPQSFAFICYKHDDLVRKEEATYEEEAYLYRVCQYYVSVANLKWVNDSGYDSQLYPVPDNTVKVTITANENNDAWITLVDSDNLINNGVPEWSDGYIRREIPADSSMEIPVPLGCKYIFAQSATATNRIPDSIVFTRKNDTESDVNTLKSLLIYDAQTEISDSDIITGYYISSTDRKWSGGHPGWTVALVPVPEKAIKVKVKANASNNSRVAFLQDDTHVYNTYPTYSLVKDTIVIQAGETFEADIPDDCEYIYLTNITDAVRTPQSVSFSYYREDFSDYEEIPLGLHTMPESEGQLNVIKRCRQCTDIKWTPAVDLPRLMLVTRNNPVPSTSSAEYYQGVFNAGVEYKGIPYGRANDIDDTGYSNAWVGSVIDFETFVTSVSNPESRVSLESQFSLTDHASVLYALVCSALTCYALNVPYKPTSQIPQISGLNLIGKINDNGTLLDSSEFKLGDVLNVTSYHTGVITDIMHDYEGNVTALEISEATVKGRADKGTSGQYGGLVIRRGWTIDEVYTEWGDYELYRYEYIASVPYTPSKYVNVGDELEMFRIEKLPCMPYEGNKFTYKANSVPNNAVKIIIETSGQYNYLRVFKDDTEIANSPYSVSGLTSVNIEEIGVGNYKAYLCNMSNGNVTKLTYKCEWKIQ